MSAEVWVGPADLAPLLMPVDELRTHPENPRRGDVPMIARSLAQFGQLKPVIAKVFDGQLTIFAGNHTYRAAQSLGWTHVAVSRPEYLSDDEAELYLLMDNRSSDQATYDYPALTGLLDERAAAGQLERTGFTAADLEQMHREAATLAGAALDEFEAGRGEPAGPPRTERTQGPPLRQMLLTFRPPETFDDFARRIQVLRKEFGTDDISATVGEAVDRAFKTVWKGGK